jgi:hypothetical protein
MPEMGIGPLRSTAALVVRKHRLRTKGDGAQWATTRKSVFYRNLSTAVVLDTFNAKLAANLRHEILIFFRKGNEEPSEPEA